MSYNVGFQIGVDLSKIFPIKDVVQKGGSSLLGMARDLRKSGPDLVVEEDLAEMVGRARIDPKLEEDFRKQVTPQNWTKIGKLSEVFYLKVRALRS